jgi:inner membrane protein involved in colicin E2 resistance
VKLTKLFRFLKIMKEKNKLMKFFTQYLKIGVGLERMVFFVLIFMIACHVGTCLWLIIASI